LTRAVARSIGLEVARAGVDLNLAPVVDVNSNPSNPVIGVRSFGADPAAVAEQAAAWVDGVQSAGVGACAKHFPGHGDTWVDSHRGLPVVGEDAPGGARRPFPAAIAGGVQGVMRGRIVVPSVGGALATICRVGVARRTVRSDTWRPRERYGATGTCEWPTMSS